MKVAIMSNLEGPCGKSSFLLLLALVYARSQQKQVSVLSTGRMRVLLDYVSKKNEKTTLNTLSVFETMMNSGSIREDEIYDYALRLADENVYAFDLFASPKDQKELQKTFFTVLKKVHSDLVLVELANQADDAFNRKVLERVDVILYLFHHDPVSIHALKEYKTNFDKELVFRTGFICQKYNADVVGEKRLSTLIETSPRNMVVFPYTTTVAKRCLDGTLDRAAKDILIGRGEVVALRPKLLEIMQYLFDTPNMKHIKGVAEWHK
jgi:cellulose biosynthesis protein BcsQ